MKNSEGKTCSKCQTLKPWRDFCKNSNRADGHHSHCRACSSEYRRKKYAIDTRYRESCVARARANRVPYISRTEVQQQSHLILKLQRRGTNVCWLDGTGFRVYRPDQLSESSQNRLAESNAKQAWRFWLYELASDEWVAKYYGSLGTPGKNHRLSKAEKFRLQYCLDPSFSLAERMRRQLNKARQRNGINEVIRSAINRNGASPKVERELGYTIAELMLHLERKFKRGMTWDRFRAGEIHIDHIIPQSHFNLIDDVQWRTCWGLDNLQPLWAEDNLRKSDKMPDHFGGIQLRLL